MGMAMGMDDWDDITKHLGPDPGEFKTITALCQAMMQQYPEARGIVLASDLYAQLVIELTDDIPEERTGLRFYVEEYGVPILCDPELQPGTGEFIAWPDTLAFEDYSPWAPKPWERK